MPKLRSMIAIPCILLGTGMHAQYMTDGPRRGPMEELVAAGERACHAGDLSSAIRIFDQVIEQDRQYLDALFQRGHCHHLNGDHELAIADLSAVIAQQHDHLQAHIDRGSSYSELGMHDLATADLDRAMAIDPENAEVKYHRGMALQAAGTPSGSPDRPTGKGPGDTQARTIRTNNR